MEEDATNLGYNGDDSKHGLFFIYYSGHGCISDLKTAGIDMNGDVIRLEHDLIDEITCRPNTTLIAYLDCCRTRRKHGKGDSNFL